MQALVTMMLCLTCLHVFGVSGKPSTEKELEDKQTDMKAEQEAEDLRSMMNAAMEKLEGQCAVIERQNAAIKKLERKGAVIEKLNFVIDAQQDAIGKLEGQGKRLDSENIIMKRQLEHLAAAESKHDDESVQVAFSVTSDNSFGPVTVPTNIPFEITDTNVGDGWISSINAFQAPVAGYYDVGASIRTEGSAGQHAYCYIVKTDLEGQSNVAALFGQNDVSGDFNRVIIWMGEGELASVQLTQTGDGSIQGGRYSTFSGFLLFQ